METDTHELPVTPRTRTDLREALIDVLARCETDGPVVNGRLIVSAESFADAIIGALNLTGAGIGTEWGVTDPDLRDVERHGSRDDARWYRKQYGSHGARVVRRQVITSEWTPA